MAYKNILSVQINEYNSNYKRVFKEYPSLSLYEKRSFAFVKMIRDRGFDERTVKLENVNPVEDPKGYQYRLEVYLVCYEVEGGITRYYIKDEDLFDFFKNTEIKPKEIKSILDMEMMNVNNNLLTFGIVGKNQSFTVVCTDYKEKHILTVLTDDMNYTFSIEDFDGVRNPQHKWVFNMAMNFLFYINAFPECVIDGTPSEVKKDNKSKTITISEKIVSHRTTEHGFVRPHFRSGYFRHLNSDYFVNCKGQVRFIASTMVKGKAKTVISKENV